MRNFVLCAVAAIFIQAAPAQLVRFRALGDLPGGDFNGQARDVSADGSTVVGWSSRSYFPGNGQPEQIYLEPYRWTPYSGMVGLGTLPGQLPLGCSAIAVSADGATIVGTGGLIFGDTRFFRWEPEAGMTELLTRQNTRWVVDVSGDAQDVLSYGWDSSAPDFVAVNMTVIPGMRTGSAISDDGTVVVGADMAGRPARWTTETGAVSLGTIPGFSDPNGAATDVSADGQLILGNVRNNDGLTRTFLWSEAGGMDELVDPGSDTAVEAIALSPDGRLACLRYDNGVSESRFWDSDHGARPIMGLLTNAGIDLSGWQAQAFAVTKVTSVNMTVVGFGRNAQGVESWVAQLCVGDLDGDGEIGIADLSVFLSSYGKCVADADFWPAADLDQRGCVDLSDLSILLANFGSRCP